MEEYLIDRETLGQFIDELIKKKPLPVDNAEELNTLREKSIREIDDRIGMAVFGRLSEPQLDEVNQLLDRPETTEAEYQEFFKRTNLDVEKIIADTMQKFAEEFLGGAE